MSDKTMPAAPLPHTLELGACSECCLVLADPDDAWCGNDRCSPTWTIACPGVDRGGCRAYWHCQTCPTPRVYDSVDEADPVAHGVEHHWIAGAWSVRSNDCLLQVGDHTADAVWEFAENHPRGRHQVFVDWDEEYPTLEAAA